VVPLPIAPPEPPQPPEPSPGEEADTEEAPKPKPKAQPKVVTKVVRMPEPPAATPHETFRMAIEALSHMARADKQSRQARYDALVSRMVK
jgi:outer membrane biosynthesis protein TonB